MTSSRRSPLARKAASARFSPARSCLDSSALRDFAGLDLRMVRFANWTSALGQDLPDQPEEITRAVGLREISGGTGLLRLHVVTRQCERSNRDDRSGGGCGFGAELTRGVQARDLRQ